MNEDEKVSENALSDLPPGWSVTECNGRRYYLTPGPKSIKIGSRAALIEHHKKKRFLEVKV